MAHRILIDGYNVIRRKPELKDQEKISMQHGREALLTLLAARYVGRPEGITVVFDGAGTYETHEQRGAIMVVFSAAGETADACIVRLAQVAQARGEQVTTCTDDQEIRQTLGGLAPHVRTQGALALASDLLAPPRLLAKRKQHHDHVRRSFDRDADPDDRPHPRKGNPRRPPKRR